MGSSRPLVEMKHISKSFPGVKALEDVDFSIYPGEVMALMGENGAGKSTLMKILSGAHKKDSGQIFIEGKEVDIKNPSHAQALGIASIYQEFNLCPNRDVASNIYSGREPLRGGILGRLGFVHRQQMLRDAAYCLKEVKAKMAPDTIVRDLSVAQKQQVEIAKALSMKAKVIIMDEPTSSLGIEDTEVLFQIIGSLRQQGIGVVFITHRMDEVFRVADRITILRDGSLVDVVMARDASVDEVIRKMVGRELTIQRESHSEHQVGEPLLEVKGLTRKGVIEDISFTLHRGEVLGMAGLIGAGRTEVARVLFGVDPKDAGEILIEGRPTALDSPWAAIREGIAFVPEDRQNQGLILKMAVRENIVMPSLSELSKNGWVLTKRADETAKETVERLNIRTPGINRKVKYLSGGNQQKVVLGKWLSRQPKILILDEPTRGIDVGAKAEVHAWVRRLAEQGLGILLISSEMPEVLSMSDRILVMHEGRLAGELLRHEATQERVMRYASGQG